MEVFTEPQPDGATHEAHGVRFIRTGSCQRCWDAPCCQGCPHLKKGKNEHQESTCLIADKLGEVCPECTEAHGGKPLTHAVCIGFPEHPFMWTRGRCGFLWAVVAEPSNLSKLQELCSLWNIAVPG